MSTSISGDGEAQMQTTDGKRGGWITFPFIIATLASMTLAGGGWQTNLMVYLMREFNVKSIGAAQISNIVNGCISFFPALSAIVAHSCLGCYHVILAFSFISFLGILCLLLTATVDSLRPKPCEIGSSFCTSPTKLQHAVLYTSLALAALGFGGIRFTLATMGANQFSKPKDQRIYFNWYFFTMYFGAVIACTAIVYVEDNISWGCGFGFCIAANVLGLAFFLVGSRYYHHAKPEGSPVTGLARVMIAAIRKRKLLASTKSEDYYYGNDGMSKMAAMPSKSFRFLNRGALITEGDVGPDGLVARPWKLCTVQQVEDFKTLIRIFSLWSSSIFLHTPPGIQISLSVLQALTMDRHLGQHFKIPPGSMLVFVLISTSLSLSLFDHFLWPAWKKLIGRSPTPLQRIGVGHVLTVASMVVSALVELKRRNIAQSHHLQGQPAGSIVHMSVLWLVPQLVIVGTGEAFHFPGQVALFYQEFPTSLKNLSTATVAMLIAIAYYLSTAVIHFVRKMTEWLPDNINDGKLYCVYWMLVVLGVFNFSYFMLCAWLYKYQNVEPQSKGIGSADLS